VLPATRTVADGAILRPVFIFVKCIVIIVSIYFIDYINTMSHMPTLKQLQYFLALCREAHFGRAAEQCHVSQSAFSMAIRELENQLELCLVDRTSRQVTITAAGREVAALARRCLTDAEELLDFARRESTPLARRVTLGVIPSIAPFVVPRLMSALAIDYPAMKLFLREEVTERLLASLFDGSIDVLLMATPYELHHIVEMPLYRDPFRFACREGSALLEHAQIRPEQIPDDSVLLLEDGHCMRDHAIAACGLRRPEKLQRFNASSLFTLVQMVAADLGVTYLPAMAEDSILLAGTGIVTRPLSARAHRDISLVWREGSSRDAEFRELGGVLQRCRPPSVLDLPRRRPPA
jgi:LysR family transcriptional regulator, hydrogen peroxide-inducible genes activator